MDDASGVIADTSVADTKVRRSFITVSCGPNTQLSSTKRDAGGGYYDYTVLLRFLQRFVSSVPDLPLP